MAKATEKYEVMYIINPNFTEEQTAAVVEKFKALVEAHGTLDELEEMGKRKLAYEINYISEGYYVLMKFTRDTLSHRPLSHRSPLPLTAISAAATAARSRPISSTASHGVRLLSSSASISPRAAWLSFPAACRCFHVTAHICTVIVPS